ncbi:hypothetical protein QBC36DRAFT_387063 [Triangularia setosa]|uniref:Transmembrane protein n=1 Tax=Triangularia setosa TaxID=2587417 RepID=A0AAN7A6D8_9PEZI|nr:hypothetical protein QBC36DRAFT_387063 [Podospora setosa]
MGTLVPPWYKRDPPSEHSLDLASFLWGAAMAIACFSFTQAVRQTRRSWLHTHKVNTYIVLVWLEWAACVIMSVISWLFLIGIIPVDFAILFGLRNFLTLWNLIVVLWTIQIQCLSQILCNRLSLLIFNPHDARRLKLSVGLAVGLINVSVYCIWLPARLQISETFIRVNNIWDRVEKALFLVIDCCLNVYFMWMVRTKLIANGLKKYELVYRFNLTMMFVSLSLDILIITLMSWEDDALYMQAHPPVYLSKLCVEMNLAELLGKVIKRSRERRASFFSIPPLTRTVTTTTTATTAPTPTSDSFLGGCPHFRHHHHNNNEILFVRNWHINIEGSRARRGSTYTGGELYNYFAHAPARRGRTGTILDDAAGLFSSAESTPAVSPRTERDIEAEGGLGGASVGCVVTDNSNHNTNRNNGGGGSSGGGGGGDDTSYGSRKPSAGSSTIVAQQGDSSSGADDRDEEGEDHRRTRHDR